LWGAFLSWKSPHLHFAGSGSARGADVDFTYHPPEALMNGNDLTKIQHRIFELEQRMDRLEKSGSHPSAKLVVLDKELDRVQHQINTINNTYSAHQSWREEDRKKYKQLAQRRSFLRKELGVVY
jgi:chromosome segregation ATPase